MTWRTRIRGSLPWAITIIGGFLAAYLLVAFVIFPSGVIPRDVQVPSVTGLTFDDAVRRLAERGLRGMRGEERFHAASPKGTVLEQSPKARSHEAENSTVTLVVSAGPKMGRVPKVVGLTREEAERVLDEAGFDVGDVIERVDNTPKGQVIDSNPKEGSEATVPSTVALMISAGPSGDTTGRGRGGRQR